MVLQVALNEFTDDCEFKRRSVKEHVWAFSGQKTTELSKQI
jgi:hypothetical protein